MTEHIQVTTAVGTAEDADRIAHELVERRLAACVQVLGPVRSTYRWRAGVQTEEEWLCLAKTRRDRYEQVEAAIRELHPYELPEVLATPVEAGWAEYLSWVDGEVFGSSLP
jgi:periplasmic divalent cation tolerance protein